MLKILIALAIIYLSIVVFCIIAKLIIGFADAFEIAKIDWEINQARKRRGNPNDHSTDHE